MPKSEKHLSCIDCGVEGADAKYPNHEKEIKRINRIAGQLEGIKRMIGERRYCPEILIQTQAVTSAIRSLEASILEKHIESCVATALAAKGKARQEKINELIALFKSR